MAVKLGTNPIAWTNDDMPELGGDTPLETCLKEAAEAGFAGIEKGGKFPNDAATVQAVLGQYGLELVSGWYSGELRTRSVEAEIAAMRPHFELLKACGCPVLIFAETAGTVQGKRDVPVADRPVMAEDEWPGYLEKIGQLADWMAGERRAHGLPPPHGHGDREGARDRPAAGRARPTRWACSTTPATSPSPARTRRRWRRNGPGGSTTSTPRTCGPTCWPRVHAERLSFLDAVVAGVYTVPGDGCIDFVAALRPVAEAGYAGWVICEAEQDPAKAHPLTYARKGYATLRRHGRASSASSSPERPKPRGGRAMPTQIQHFIGGKLVARPQRPDRAGLQPGDRRAERRGAAGQRGRGRRGGAARARRLSRLGDDHALAPGADPQPLPAAARGAPDAGSPRRSPPSTARSIRIRWARSRAALEVVEFATARAAAARRAR